MNKGFRFTDECKQNADKCSNVFRVHTPCSEKRALDQLFEICKQCPLSRHGLHLSEKPSAPAKRCCASEEE